MSKQGKADLERFLASLPIYQRKFLEHGFSSLTPPEKEQFNNWLERGGSPLIPLVTTPVLPLVISALHWAKLSQMDAMVKRYRKIAKEELWKDYQSFLEVLPKAKLGRPENVEVCQTIWKLHADGMTNRQIQNALKDKGKNLSLEAVESYLKTRRRSRTA